MRLHLNENTAGCSPRSSRRCAALTPATVALLSGLRRRGSPRARAASSRAEQLLLTNGLDEGHSGVDGRGAARPRRDRPKRSSWSRRSTCMRRPCERRARASSTCRRRPTSVPLTRCSRRSPDDADHLLTNPNNPTGLSIPMSDIADRARGAARARVRRRGLCRLLGRDADRRSRRRARCRTSSSAGRSPRPTAWPACAPAR